MKNKQFDPLDYRIFEGVTGSQLYGMATPESDYDTRGICLPPLKVLIDPFMSFDVKDSFDGEDRSIYNLAKFMNLCADNNPNVLELLYVPEQFIVFKTDLWIRLVENRHLFLSKNVKHRFVGYAFSQLEAIKRHREWFIQPPDHKPKREEFNLMETPTISMAWLNSLKMTMNFDIIKDEFVEEIRKEQAYKDAKRKWDNYIQWETNRNPKRKASEEKLGFDGKYASHLFRLMTEGKELLLTGNITFPLPNADWLLSIKQGFYSYEQILEMATNMEAEFETWYEQSPLPDKPNRNALKELYFEMVLGKGYSNICSICDEKGHWADECPTLY